jgi:hypothetical protein
MLQSLSKATPATQPIVGDNLAAPVMLIFLGFEI